jgi:hypothetical protein
MQKTLTKKEIKEIILTELPGLIRKDPKTREFILQLAQERFADKKKTEDRFETLLKEIEKLRVEGEKKWEEMRRWWNENQKKWEENQRRWEENEKKWKENQRRWEENQKRLEKMEEEWNKKWEENQKKWEENQKKWEENQKVINEILAEIKLLHRKHDTSIGALGARWGFRAERSFRDAIKAILEESFPVKVQRYHAKDEEGLVFGRPDQIELDLIVKNGEVIVAEIKSSISKGDVATFIRKLEFYTKKEGRPVTRKLLISPMIDSSAKELAESAGIEVYGYPEEVDFQELQN